MKTLIRLSGVFALMMLGVGIAATQAVDDYRTAGSGTWVTASVWERWSGSAWVAATTAPDSGAGAIAIQSGHTVTVDADLVVDSVTVLGGGALEVNAGVTVTVPFNSNMIGIEVDTLGTATVNGTIVCKGNVAGADSSIVFNDGSVYEHARDEGDVPWADWRAGSTFRLTGTVANAPANSNQNFYHVVIDCPNITANLNLGMSGNSIRGNVTVLNTASNRYYLTSPTDYVDPITILGDIIVTGGTFSSNGSSSNADIIVHTYGDVIVTGGNFGCSRGSGTSVSWYLYGDTMSVSNATLQNSTSSPDKIQKFIFAKQGTQYLRWSNVSYGSGGFSPITLQVGGGTTLDIGTTSIPASNTGSFILDSAATLVSTHNGPGDEGSIACLANLGGGNSFINVNATEGTGTVTRTAYKGPHPNIYDANTSLQRYWTMNATGITTATLTLYYYDLDQPDTEVRGAESEYKALRYSGTANGWFTLSGSTVDDLFDFVEATEVSTISGDWTVGEPAPPLSASDAENQVPQSFFVDQNYPNPFNPSTTIIYGLPEQGFVTAKVFNLLGQEVATLFEGVQAAGVHEVVFDASRLTSGIYLYRVQANGVHTVRQMVLLK